MKTQRLAHWKIVIVLGFKLVMLVFDYTVFACHKDVGSMTKVVEDVMTISNAPPSSEWTRRWPIGNGKENKSFLCRQILFRLNQNQSKPWMILFSRGRETLELITKGGHASLRPFRALPLFAKNFTQKYLKFFKTKRIWPFLPKTMFQWFHKIPWN